MVLTPSLWWPLPSSHHAQPHPAGLRTHGNQEERQSSPSVSPSESAHHTTEVTQRRQSSKPHPPIPGEGASPSARFPRVRPAPPIPLRHPRKTRSGARGMEGWMRGKGAGEGWAPGQATSPRPTPRQPQPESLVWESEKSGAPRYSHLFSLLICPTNICEVPTVCQALGWAQRHEISQTWCPLLRGSWSAGGNKQGNK